MTRHVDLAAGNTVLLESGPAVVVALERHGVVLRDVLGQELSVRWDRLVLRKVDGAAAQSVHASLEPWWSSLDDGTRRQALLKLEVVMEILTGYRSGLPEVALPEEPFTPFGPGYGESLDRRIRAMSRQLSFERSLDRVLIARIVTGQLQTTRVAPRTIHSWVTDYRTEGLRGLVDKRSTRGRQGWEALDPRFVQIADDVLTTFDGTVSKVNLIEIERRIHVRLKQEGITDLQLPQRLAQQYLSQRYAALGSTARGHKGLKMRKRRGFDSYPDIHPGHLAVDVTRADNLVWDDVHGRAFSVEIVTFISVPARVVVACRVVPRSATAIDVAMGLYDAMRPFSMVVNGTTIDDFRWCGIPASLDFSPTHWWLTSPR